MEASHELAVFEIKERGYGSNFDSMNFTINLCNDCERELEIEKEWFDNDLCFNEGSGEYKNELYIINLIETLSEKSQAQIISE